MSVSFVCRKRLAVVCHSISNRLSGIDASDGPPTKANERLEIAWVHGMEHGRDAGETP
jgi:hypothetical protein